MSHASVHSQDALTYHRSYDDIVVFSKVLPIATTLQGTNQANTNRGSGHGDREDQEAEAMVLHSDSVIRTDEEGHRVGCRWLLMMNYGLILKLKMVWNAVMLEGSCLSKWKIAVKKMCGG